MVRLGLRLDLDRRFSQLHAGTVIASAISPLPMYVCILCTELENSQVAGRQLLRRTFFSAD
jgi:hypothetical protein